MIPRSEFDTNVAEREVAKAGVDATQEQIAAAQRAVAAADAKVASTEKQVAAARAALDESRANFGDTQVQSPIKGVVMTKVAEQGEVLAAGSPIVVLVDIDHLHEGLCSRTGNWPRETGGPLPYLRRRFSRPAV